MLKSFFDFQDAYWKRYPNCRYSMGKCFVDTFVSNAQGKEIDDLRKATTRDSTLLCHRYILMNNLSLNRLPVVNQAVFRPEFKLKHKELTHPA